MRLSVARPLIANAPRPKTRQTSASVQKRSRALTSSTSPACGPNSGIPVVRVTSQRITIARLPATPSKRNGREDRRVALEYAPRGVRINAICPGTIETAMVEDMIAKDELDVPEANQPIGRLGRADEIAAAVLWLCSPAASFVLGVALPVDGGYTAR